MPDILKTYSIFDIRSGYSGYLGPMQRPQRPGHGIMDEHTQNIEIL